MGIIANPERQSVAQNKITPKKSFADTKRWLSNEFYQALNRHVMTEDGDYVTYGQSMIQGVVEMATDPQKDDYLRLAAAKFIIEHMEGKAASMQDEHNEEMPKIVVCLNDTSVSDIKDNIKTLDGAEPTEDILVEIEGDNGEIEEELIV